MTNLWVTSAPLPVISVQTVYAGASPYEVETGVSRPLEDALGSLNGVKTVRSTSIEGPSQINVEFNLEHQEPISK